MYTHSLRCPNCGATPPPTVTPNAPIRCPYCQHVYAMQAPPPPPVHIPVPVYFQVPAPPPPRPSGCAAPGFLLGIIATVAGLCVVGMVASGRRRSNASKYTRSTYTQSSQFANPYRYTPRPITSSLSAFPATVRFEQDGQLPGYRNAFYYLGWVTNTSPFAIDRARVTAVLTDAQGREVLSPQGFTERDMIRPQERVPIKILVRDPPMFARVRFETTANRAGDYLREVVGLSAELGTARRSQYGASWEVSGRVLHRGAERARFVKVEIQALDANGHLLDVQSSYVDGEALDPGAVGRFHSLSLSPPVAPARFALYVSGRPVR